MPLFRKIHRFLILVTALLIAPSATALAQRPGGGPGFQGPPRGPGQFFRERSSSSRFGGNPDSRPSFGMNRPTPGNPGQSGMAAGMFERLDRNRDGQLSLDEFQKLPEMIRARKSMSSRGPSGMLGGRGPGNSVSRKGFMGRPGMGSRFQGRPGPDGGPQHGRGRPQGLSDRRPGGPHGNRQDGPNATRDRHRDSRRGPEKSDRGPGGRGSRRPDGKRPEPPRRGPGKTDRPVALEVEQLNTSEVF